MDFRTWLETASTPLIAYHHTSLENAKKIKRRGFSLPKSTQGIIWFTSELDADTGAQASGAVIKIEVDIKNPAGWKEYHNLLLGQLKSQGHDGAILPEKYGTFDGFVFSPKQIKILEIIEN